MDKLLELFDFYGRFKEHFPNSKLLHFLLPLLICAGIWKKEWIFIFVKSPFISRKCKLFIFDHIDQNLSHFINEIESYLKDKETYCIYMAKQLKNLAQVNSLESNIDDYPCGIKALAAFVSINETNPDDTYQTINKLLKSTIPKTYNQTSNKVFRHVTLLNMVIEEGIITALKNDTQKDSPVEKKYSFILEDVKNKCTEHASVMQTLIKCLEYIRNEKASYILFELAKSEDEGVQKAAIDMLEIWNGDEQGKRRLSDNGADSLANYIFNHPARYPEDHLIQFVTIFGNTLTPGGPNILNSLIDEKKFYSLCKMKRNSESLNKAISDAAFIRGQVGLEGETDEV